MIIDSHIHLHPTEDVGKMVVEKIGLPYYSYSAPDDYVNDMKSAGINMEWL